jgi:energy-converting hydrogenase Eha subunit A
MTAPVRRPTDVRQRSWLEVRWRQFRNAPRPVVRAVLSSLIVAMVLGLGYLLYDLAIRRGAVLPGGDLRTLYLVVDVLVVLIVGSVVTYLVVPQPRGSGTRTTRSAWSAALGFFAAVPVAYLVLVVVAQVLEPLLS